MNLKIPAHCEETRSPGPQECAAPIPMNYAAPDHAARNLAQIAIARLWFGLSAIAVPLAIISASIFAAQSLPLFSIASTMVALISLVAAVVFVVALSIAVYGTRNGVSLALFIIVVFPIGWFVAILLVREASRMLGSEEPTDRL